jgi:tRNA pseudouridine55 synthase
MNYEGILPVFKPTNYTSHDVVAKLRRILGLKRIGHTGTLDPLVTGVLPICLGRATRVAEYVQDLPKEYEAQLTIGFSTDTEDISGNIIEKIDPQRLIVDDKKIQNALEKHTGKISQIPPMYSAVKVNGQKLYQLARAGVMIERPSRMVEIYRLEFLQRTVNDEGYPVISFRVLCSKGTYIRTLCADIGKSLGFPAVMSNLVRTSSGGFSLAEAVHLEDIERLHQSGELHSLLLAADRAINHFPDFIFDELKSRQLRCGVSVNDFAINQLLNGDIVRAYDQRGTFIGLLLWNEERKQLIPHKIWS